MGVVDDDSVVDSAVTADSVEVDDNCVAPVIIDSSKFSIGVVVSGPNDSVTTVVRSSISERLQHSISYTRKFILLHE